MVGVLGTGLTNVIIAIALSHWAWYSRMVRGLVIHYANTVCWPHSFLARPCAGVRSSGRRGNAHQLLVLATLDIGHMMLHIAGGCLPWPRCDRADRRMGRDD